jgi:hypothetical protein
MGWETLTPGPAGPMGPQGPAAGPHHATHETGGADAITALSGGVITSGTVADARLSANVPLLNQANVFTAVVQQITGNNPDLRLWDSSQPVDGRLFRILSSGGLIYFQAVNDAISAQQGAVTISRAGILTAAGLGATPLSGSQVTAGTVADARLSANVALKNAANVFTNNQTLQAPNMLFVFTDTSGAVDARLWRIVAYSNGIFRLEALNDAQTVAQTAYLFDRSGNFTAAGVHYEQGRAAAMGFRTNIAYNAANYTTYPAGTWTVPSGNIQTNAYSMVGKTAFFAFVISDSTVSAGVTTLAISNPIPGAAGTSYATAPSFHGTLNENGTVYCQPGDANIYIRRPGGVAWPASSGQIMFTLTFLIP